MGRNVPSKLLHFLAVMQNESLNVMHFEMFSPTFLI